MGLNQLILKKSNTHGVYFFGVTRKHFPQNFSAVKNYNYYIPPSVVSLSALTVSYFNLRTGNCAEREAVDDHIQNDGCMDDSTRNDFDWHFEFSWKTRLV